MIERRLERLLGQRLRSLRRVEGRGYSIAFRATVHLADGRSVFVKAGVEEVTSEFLRAEQRFYRAVAGTFMPRLVAVDEEDPPLLVLEDLSGGRWPPPWDDALVGGVLETLAEIAATPPPHWLPPIASEAQWLLGGWAEIEREPAPFLSLGLCSSQWLEGALHALRRAAESAPIDGDALLHLDVRSDNVCLSDGRVVLVDWNNAMVGNPELDVAGWLSSLALEGGPQPEELLPSAPGFAAAFAGFFGSRAGLPPPETAPTVRAVQLAQLQVALPWAVRALELPPLG